MHNRLAQFAGGVALVLIVAVVATLMLSMWHAGDDSATIHHPTRAEVRNPAGCIDRLVLIDTAAQFAKGAVERTTVNVSGAAGIVHADDRSKGWPLEGTWTSPVMTP